MNKYHRGHFSLSLGFLAVVVSFVILTIAIAGMLLASIWVESLRSVTPWFGVLWGVGLCYICWVTLRYPARIL